MKDKARKGLVIAGGIYAGLVILILFLLRTPLSGLWWMRLAGDFLPLWSVALLPLAILGLLLSRNWAARALMCVPCLILVLHFGGLFVSLPAPSSVEETESSLTVMTYNLNRGHPGLEAILSIIVDEDADVVALQEVSPAVAEAVASLSDTYPYQAVHPTPDGFAGCAILSRYPIADDEVFPLVPGAHLSQRVTIDLGGERLRLHNVHLQPPRIGSQLARGALFFVRSYYDTSIQDEELARLLQEVDGEDGAVMVVGDFNMTEQSPGYREITRRVIDAYRTAGWGLGNTFPDRAVHSVPTPFPVIRIDYVFHSREMKAQRAEVGDRGGPDHRYVVAELAL